MDRARRHFLRRLLSPPGGGYLPEDDPEYLMGIEVGVPVLGFDHSLRVVTGEPPPPSLRRLEFDHMWVINSDQCPVTLGASGTGGRGHYFVEFYLGVEGARRLARYLLHAADREDPASDWSVARRAVRAATHRTDS